MASNSVNWPLSRIRSSATMRGDKSAALESGGEVESEEAVHKKESFAHEVQGESSRRPPP